MSEVKRRKGNISKPNEDEQKKQVVKSTKSMRMDLQTASSLLSLVASLGLLWFLFQQSVQLAAVEKKYHILKEEAVKFQDMENKISTISEKCEIVPSLTKQLEDLNVIPQMKHLQNEISIMQIRSNRLIQEEEELHRNLTSLSDAIAKHEEKTKGISVKIADVKTDIRRISGLQTDISLLVENLEILEDKVNKVEKAIIQNIGDVLTSSIDRTTKLKNIASENSREVKYIKEKSFELKADSTKQLNKLLELESDRAKVLTTVAFANELKPKVHNLKNDLAHLLLILDELTLRIGRLLGDLLESQKELALLNKKLSNLTSVQTETE
ncbi:PREDICTED: inhibitor of nuclear factor kappa-B kinase-interacting protein isoform X1 [Thamnophis sirtalis]|uniref:Inhibitor of nuclear factor kappa-B kinase-interacting protein isoform X1 n=1 Tax=Thamnophis sirtalis TaxID=35019 RepID=A0A6I9X6K2_9SAUR|nr:PREDICTED: inhibitor of nuclear factor kappa-B kinase-interacting protein isoform X1 [Thamnophis sirtalis]